MVIDIAITMVTSVVTAGTNNITMVTGASITMVIDVIITDRNITRDRY